MGKTLYLECASGISGDMVVGALLDLGANEAGLRRALDSLKVDGFEIAVTRKLVSGIDACDFDVVLDEEHESHDHDMAYLYGDLDGTGEADHDHEHEHGHEHEHEHHHDHEHEHDHDHDHEQDHEDDHGHEHEHDHDEDQEDKGDKKHGRKKRDRKGRGRKARGRKGHGDKKRRSVIAALSRVSPHLHDRHHDDDQEPELQADHDQEHEVDHDHAHDHDHDHAHDHDHDHAHDHNHDHEHDHGHDHDHHHGHGHHHHHEHRTPADIAAIIDAADLAPRAKQTAHRIFDIVAQAESKAHGLPLEEIHFHEVGAVDSIVDVVAVAYCLDDLDVSDAYVTPLAEGHGRVRCAHGVLSIPVPAVANIVAAHGLVLQERDIEGELVTPTGAAIAAAVRTMDAPPAAYRVLKTGLGSGKRAYDPPSTVRALIIEEVTQAPAVVETQQAPVVIETEQAPAVVEAAAEAPTGVEAAEAPAVAEAAVEAPARTEAEQAPASAVVEAPLPVEPQQGLGMPDLWKLETELDDCTGEALGNVMQLLYDAGALEAHYLPVFMKKNRPGYQIEILCSAAKITELENIVFENTTTIGIRRCPEWRTALPREARQVETPLGLVQVKMVTLPSGARRSYPEHDSVAQLAAKAQISYQEALRVAIAAIEMEE